MAGLIKSAATKRAEGDKPSPPHAAVAAVAAGAAVAVLAYRVMRS